MRFTREHARIERNALIRARHAMRREEIARRERAARYKLKARMIECVFEEWRPGGWKVISFSAKKARGLMARYAIMKRVETPRKLEQFNLEGYAFDPAASQAERLVFRRRTTT